MTRLAVNGIHNIKEFLCQEKVVEIKSPKKILADDATNIYEKETKFTIQRFKLNNLAEEG